MSLPPALLQRLAQRGLVQKQKDAAAAAQHKSKNSTNASAAIAAAAAENEEVIAEDYDNEIDGVERSTGPEDYPSQYDYYDSSRKRNEDNFWLERMKARMGEVGSTAGHKGCPNKYNIYHKCTVYCVNRWGDGHTEPTREYMRRYKRLLRKYPLPKGWTEIYDAGCGCFYFYNSNDSMVSWLPPTHPKSQISKSAAVYRRQLEESVDGVNAMADSDAENAHTDDEDGSDNAADKQAREIDDIINSMRRSNTSPNSKESLLKSQEFPSLQEALAAAPNTLRKPKSRDLDKTLARQRRDKERARERSGRHHHGARDDVDILDPMDPSAYSDTPRGKWSDGLQTAAAEERKRTSSSSVAVEAAGKERRKRERREKRSSDEQSDDE